MEKVKNGKMERERRREIVRNKVREQDRKI